MRVETRAGNNGLWADMNKSSHRSNPFRRQPQTRTAAILRSSDTTNHHFLEINYYFGWKVKKKQKTYTHRKKSNVQAMEFPEWKEGMDERWRDAPSSESPSHLRKLQHKFWFVSRAALKSTISSGIFDGQQGSCTFILSPTSEDRWRRRDGGIFQEEERDGNSTDASHPNSLNKLFTERDSESEYASVSIVPLSSADFISNVTSWKSSR